MKALEERNELNTEEIDDVIISCSRQIDKQGSCIGRMAALDAGYSMRASGMTLDRFCGGGITSVNLAAANIMSGMEDLVVAGGVEMMSYTATTGGRPLDADNEDLRNAHPQTNVGIAADIIATEEGFSRAELDAFSAESQVRAGAAIEAGAFDKSLIPVMRPDGTLALDAEEFPRPQTTVESLANLQPVFGNFMDMPFFDTGLTFKEMVRKKWPDLEIEHVHHAGSSSGVVDGAGAVVMASPEYAKKHGLKPRAKICLLYTSPSPRDRG